MEHPSTPTQNLQRHSQIQGQSSGLGTAFRVLTDERAAGCVCVCAFVFGWERRDGAAFTELTEESTDTLSLHLDSIWSETVKLWFSPANNINISYISKHRFHFP